tara:strand:- start:174 stop:347 length:174 start_codon:yes stop_codon:yes gene_type:complete
MIANENLFSDWDDFMDAVDSLVEKGIVERYTMDDGEVGLRLTDTGKTMAAMLEKEDE